MVLASTGPHLRRDTGATRYIVEPFSAAFFPCAARLQSTRQKFLIPPGMLVELRGT
jgi:hypothetical protein